MTYGHLTDLQRNDLAHIVRERAFRRADSEWQRFELKEGKEPRLKPGPYPCVIHKPSGATFGFGLMHEGKKGPREGHHGVFYGPAEDSPGALVYGNTWQQVLSLVDMWLVRVRRSLEEGDLWAQEEIDPGLLLSAAIPGPRGLAGSSRGPGIRVTSRA